MDELETALMRWYGVKANRIESFMDGYVVRSGGTDKYFRKNLFSAGRLLFIHGAKEHLAGNGLNNIDRYILTLNGEPYIEYQESFYTLTEKYNGKECDFYEIGDVLTAIRSVAKMHLASSGYSVCSDRRADCGHFSALLPGREQSPDSPASSPVSPGEFFLVPGREQTLVPAVPAPPSLDPVSSVSASVADRELSSVSPVSSAYGEPSTAPTSPVPSIDINSKHGSFLARKFPVACGKNPCAVQCNEELLSALSTEASPGLLDTEPSSVSPDAEPPLVSPVSSADREPSPVSAEPPPVSPVTSADRESSPVLSLVLPVLPVSRLGKLPGLYERKLRELKKLKNYARRGRTQFDEIFMSVADRFYDHGRASLNRIRGEAYRRLVEKAYKAKSFCHGNLSHKTIVFGDKGVHIKGFECCGYDIRVMDIVDIVRKRFKKCGWSVDDAASIINGYDRVNSLSNDELEVIKGMLQFPYRFWELSNRFYNSKRGWAEKSYTPKLAELAESMGQIDRFVEKLDDILR